MPSPINRMTLRALGAGAAASAGPAKTSMMAAAPSALPTRRNPNIMLTILHSKPAAIRSRSTAMAPAIPARMFIDHIDHTRMKVEPIVGGTGGRWERE
jgi:hypothetical protein